MKIHFFWTWAAVNPSLDNTFFYIEDGGLNMFVDCGGWNTLYQSIKQWIAPQPNYLFQTHAHTDHILWFPHLIRIIKKGSMSILSSEYIQEKFKTLCNGCELAKVLEDKLGQWLINFITLHDKHPVVINDSRSLTPINLLSEKVEQYWFALNIKDKKIVYFGDENINILPRVDLGFCENADLLICESFCLSTEIEERDPYGKHHVTAKDAWLIAKKLKAKKLAIVHVEESKIENQKDYLIKIQHEASEQCNIETIAPSAGDDIEC